MAPEAMRSALDKSVPQPGNWRHAGNGLKHLTLLCVPGEFALPDAQPVGRVQDGHRLHSVGGRIEQSSGDEPISGRAAGQLHDDEYPGRRGRRVRLHEE